MVAWDRPLLFRRFTNVVWAEALGTTMYQSTTPAPWTTIWAIELLTEVPWLPGNPSRTPIMSCHSVAVRNPSFAGGTVSAYHSGCALR